MSLRSFLYILSNWPVCIRRIAWRLNIFGRFHISCDSRQSFKIFHQIFQIAVRIQYCRIKLILSIQRLVDPKVDERQLNHQTIELFSNFLESLAWSFYLFTQNPVIRSQIIGKLFDHVFMILDISCANFFLVYKKILKTISGNLQVPILLPYLSSK